MPPTKFQLNLTYHSGADVVSTFSRWPQWQPSWILERNEFSNSKSPLPSPHPHPQCLPPSLGSIRLMVHEQMWLENIQEAHRSGHLVYYKETILAILNLYVALTYSLGGDIVRRFSRQLPWWPSWILERKDFRNS